MRYLFTFLCVFFFLAGGAQAKRIGLVIGNDSYRHLPPHYQLQKAKNDARATADTFQLLGFEIIKGFDLSRREMSVKLSTLAEKIQPGDEVLFFFAGHGVRIDGLNYLLPSDIPSIDSANETLLKAEALRVDQVTDLLRSKGARLSILVLDACRNNPYQDHKGRSIGATRGLAAMDPPEGTIVLFSAGAGQTALDRLSDDDPNPNSVFTRTFLPLVAQKGGELSSLSRQIKARVRELALTIGHKQTPAVYNEVIGNVYLSGKGESKTVTAIRKGPDELLWGSIKDSKDASDFEFYLKERPKGQYASVARLKLEQFKAQRQKLVSSLVFKNYEQVKSKPWIGVYIIALKDGAGLRVSSLDSHGSAKVAGLRKGDVITRYDGKVVTSVKMLVDMIKANGVGGKSEVQFLRDGRSQTVFITSVSRYHLFEGLIVGAHRGNVEDVRRLGQELRWGHDLEKNVREAVKWYERAALKGDLQSIKSLAFMYNYDSELKDKIEAVKWYRKAVDKGDVGSMTSLAYFYETGTGGLQKDLKKSFDLLSRAADQGEIGAYRGLGRYYTRGENGKSINRNTQLGFNWYKKAALSPKANASDMWYVGYMYEFGQWTKIDYVQSHNWYLKASEKGDSFSLYQVALNYDKGRAVKRDAQEAARLIVQSLTSKQKNTRDYFKKYWGDLTVQTRRGIQRLLAEKNLYKGKIDGQMGPGSLAAIEKLDAR